MLSRLLAEPTFCAPKIRHCSLMGPGLSFCSCLPNGQGIMLCLFVYNYGPCTQSHELSLNLAKIVLDLRN